MTAAQLARPVVPRSQAPRRADPRAVLSLIWAGGAAVLGFWLVDAPSVHNLGDALTAAGRITGLLAGYAMVALLALMARIPALERGVGSDRLARWHASGGRYTVCLVVAHGLLIWWGYAVSAHLGMVAQGSALLLSYPDVLMATVGGLLLVGVGLVSVRAARRRMRYETWYYLHFYTYLAVALAFSHQFATGADFVANAPARVAWSAMYLAVAALLLWFRFITPVRQALRHRLRVVDVQRESADVVSVVVEGYDLQSLQAEPGQFFRWRFLTRDLWWSANPYSLSAPITGNRMRVTVKDLGDHSRSLARLRPGTRVIAEGPYGAFGGGADADKALLVAGGVGITPVRALFQTLPARDVVLVYRVGDTDEALFLDELQHIAARRGARLHLVTGHRRDLGHDPLSGAALRHNVPDLADREVWVCGPARLTAAVVDVVRRSGVPAARIHHESFEL